MPIKHRVPVDDNRAPMNSNRFRIFLEPQAVCEAVARSCELQALPQRTYRKADAYPTHVTEAMREFDMQLGDLAVPDSPPAKDCRTASTRRR